MALTRRNLLKQIEFFSIGYISIPLSRQKPISDLTPEQIEGPFYPLKFPIDDDNDLTWIGNKKNRFVIFNNAK